MSGTISHKDGFLVEKKYTNPQRFHNELNSYLAVQKTNVHVPKLHSYNIDDQSIYIEKINLQSLEQIWNSLDEKSNEKAHSQIATNLFNLYKVKPSAKNTSWSKFLDSLKNSIDKKLKKYTEYRKDNFAKMVKYCLNEAEQIKNSDHILHRDLTQGNIFIGDNGAYFIDFEHSINGPIEFEFANEGFWKGVLAPKDDKYISAKFVKEYLVSQYQIKYRFELDTLMAIIYGIEQFIDIEPENRPYNLDTGFKVLHSKMKIYCDQNLNGAKNER